MIMICRGVEGHFSDSFFHSLDSSLVYDSGCNDSIKSNRNFMLLGTEKADKEVLEKELQIEEAIEKDSIYTTPTPSPGNDATWAEVKELEVSNLVKVTQAQNRNGSNILL